METAKDEPKAGAWKGTDDRAAAFLGTDCKGVMTHLKSGRAEALQVEFGFDSSSSRSAVLADAGCGKVAAGVIELVVAGVGLGYYALNSIIRDIGLALGLVSLTIVLGSVAYIKVLQSECVELMRGQLKKDGSLRFPSEIMTPADVGEAAGGAVLRVAFVFMQVAKPTILSVAYVAYALHCMPKPASIGEVSNTDWTNLSSYGVEGLLWRLMIIGAAVSFLTLPARYCRSWIAGLGLVGFLAIVVFLAALLCMIEGNHGLAWWPREDRKDPSSLGLVKAFFAATSQFFALNAFMGYYLTHEQRAPATASQSLTIMVCIVWVVYVLSMIVVNRAVGLDAPEQVFKLFDSGGAGETVKILAGLNLLVSIGLMMLASFQEIEGIAGSDVVARRMQFAVLLFVVILGCGMRMEPLSRVCWLLGVLILPCQQGLIHGIAYIRLRVKTISMNGGGASKCELLFGYFKQNKRSVISLVLFGAYLILCTVYGFAHMLEKIMNNGGQ